MSENNETTLRTQKEINQEYTNQATQFGDKWFKIQILNEELKNHHQNMTKLAQEKATPEEKTTS